MQTQLRKKTSIILFAIILLFINMFIIFAIQHIYCLRHIYTQIDELIQVSKENKFAIIRQEQIIRNIRKNTEWLEEKEYIEIVAEVTAYTAGPESTGKSSGDPWYAITASGRIVTEGITVAAPIEFPIGTSIYIPGYGISEVQDRGSDIRWWDDKEIYQFDVYIEDLERALKWGRRVLTIKISIQDLTDEDIQIIKRQKGD